MQTFCTFCTTPSGCASGLCFLADDGNGTSHAEEAGIPRSLLTVVARMARTNCRDVAVETVTQKTSNSSRLEDSSAMGRGNNHSIDASRFLPLETSRRPSVRWVAVAKCVSGL